VGIPLKDGISLISITIKSIMAYSDEYTRVDHPHFKERSTWVHSLHGTKPVKVLGCGYGRTVWWLNEMGVEVSGLEVSAYAIKNSYIPDRVFKTLSVAKGDFVVSWNMLDAVSSEAKALKLIKKINRAEASYHVLCTDDGRQEAKNFKKDGFFIRHIDWWLERVDKHVVLVDYYSKKPYNTKKKLHMPLCWGLISK
jgi:hypothetical protein